MQYRKNAPNTTPKSKWEQVVCARHERIRTGKQVRRILARQGKRLGLWLDTQEDTVLYSTGNLVIEKFWEEVVAFDPSMYPPCHTKPPTCEQAFSLLFTCDTLKLLGVGASGIAFHVKWNTPRVSYVVKISNDESVSEQTQHFNLWGTLNKKKHQCKNSITRPFRVDNSACELPFAVSLQEMLSPSMQSLTKILQSPRSKNDISLIALAVAKSLICFHVYGKTAHGDLHPSNVFLDKNFKRAVLVDLGDVRGCNESCLQIDLPLLGCDAHKLLCSRIEHIYKNLKAAADRRNSLA